MNLTQDEIVRYWETRLLGQRIPRGRARIPVKCPLHDDRTASATVFLDGNGGFNCNGCRRKGNLFQFEAMLSNCDLAEAERNVASITGARAQSHGAGQLVAVYDYRDASGKILFQKRKYLGKDGKTFRVYRADGKGGWQMGIDPEEGERTRRVLFHLQEVVTANVILLAEGEKDCETLDALDLFREQGTLRVATATNFEGAWQPGQSPKWLDEYSAYCAGKFVFVFEDNDASGQAWGEHVARSVARFARGVKIVRLPGLKEKGDVSDWMETHAAQELTAEMSRAPLWKAEKQQVASQLFVPCSTFVAGAKDDIEWLIEGVMQRGANGFIVAPPKGGKSFVTTDMLLSLALGVPWLRFAIPRPVRCGICSREDNPALTAWRIWHIFAGKKCPDPELIDRNLYVNSRAQTPRLMLDDEAQLQELICAVRERELELLFLDVFNVLHGLDENDNTEMRKVLANVSRIQTETGCSVGIIHHFNKMESGSLTQRMRGSSALAGFAEWIIGIKMADEENKIRCLEFETKASAAPNPIYFQIDSETFPGITRVVRREVDGEKREPAKPSRGRKESLALDL